MIDLEEVIGDEIKEIRKEGARRRKKLLAIKTILEKLIPALPEGWGIWFNKESTVYITKSAKTDALEFRLVCDLVEQITGRRAQKVGDTSDGKRVELRAYFWECSVYVEMENATGCELIPETKTVTAYRVSDNCAGIRAEGQLQ